MGTSDILKVLEKKSDLTTTELAELTALSIASVKRIVSSLIKDVSENIVFRELTEEEKIERYGKNVPARIRVYRLE